MSWQLRAYAGRNVLTRKPEYRYRSFRGTERDARKALAAFVTEVAKAGATVDTNSTLREVWADYARLMLPTLSIGTATGYEKNWRNHVEPALGRRSLGESCDGRHKVRARERPPRRPPRRSAAGQR